MALKNRSMYAILGILSLSPSTGYDIKKYSDNVLTFFWNENFGHIYPTLKKMLDEGMIEIVSHSCLDKKIVYDITESGRKEFLSWLMEDTVPQPVRSEFMLKLLFSSTLPKDNIIETLENYKARQKARVKAYIDMQDSLQRGIREVAKERVVFLNAILRSGILASEAAIKWCDETIEDVRRIEN